MKKITTISLLAFSLVAGTMFNSCKKDDDSAYQPKGTYGNANTVHSNTLNLSNWSNSFDNGTDFAYTSVITWPEITQDIKDNGVVMMYIHDNTTTNWTALPYSDAGTGYSEAFDFEVATGQITLTFTGYDNSGSPGVGAMNGIFTVRVVAISQAQRHANPNLNLNDYNAVKKAFHLRD